MPHVLLLGGHGKISLLMTPLLLQRSWTLTSLIRSPDQKADVESAAGAHVSNLRVKVADLEAIQSQEDAQSILNDTKPNYVIFSAGEYSMTCALDQLAKRIRRQALAANLLNPELTPSIATLVRTSSMPQLLRHLSPNSSWSPTSVLAALALLGGPMKVGLQRRT